MAQKEAAIDDMPPEILAELEVALRMSYDESNVVPYETLKTEMKTWLQTLSG